MIAPLLITMARNNVGMNNVSCKYSWDEQCFLHIVLGVQLHPNHQVQPQCMNNKYSQFVQRPIEYNWHILGSRNQLSWLKNVRFAKHSPDTKPQIYKCPQERHFFLYICIYVQKDLIQYYSNIGPIVDDTNNVYIYTHIFCKQLCDDVWHHTSWDQHGKMS
jgi:hypothetical protein